MVRDVALTIDNADLDGAKILSVFLSRVHAWQEFMYSASELACSMLIDI
jgi:hypothetical protein